MYYRNVCITEIDFIIKSLSQEIALRPDSFSGEFHQTIKKIE